MFTDNKKGLLALSIATALATLSYTVPSNAEVNSKGGAFLYGKNIQVGINQHGAFGSEEKSAIAPYDASPNKIGFISDPNGNSFTGAFDGDFFMPEIAEAGWGVQLKGENYHNSRNYQDDSDLPTISGSFSNFKDLETTQEVTWTGSINDELTVNQTFSIFKNGLTAIVDVELTNTTGTLMENVYYMQTVDPDNNYQSSDEREDLKTTNAVINQGDEDGIAVVSASQNRAGEDAGASEIKLIGYAKNARVSFGGKKDRNPAEVYTGTADLKTTGEEFSDTSISLAFKYDKIAPGETVKFKLAFQLANSPIPKLTLDADGNSKAGIPDAYKTLYIVGGSAKEVADLDLEVTASGQENLNGAEIVLTTPQDNDLISLSNNLPEGISKDVERSTDTKLILKGTDSLENYKKALKLVQYSNSTTNPDLSERVINTLIVDSVYTLSNAAQTLISVVIPVTIEGKIATDDIVNEAEKNKVSATGEASPDLDVKLVFTDKNDAVVNATTKSDTNGTWNIEDVNLTTLADGEITLSASTEKGGYTSAAEKTFEKDANPVDLAINSPKADQLIASNTLVVSGTTEPNLVVTVNIDDDHSCEAKADTEGKWSCSISDLSFDTSYPITATTEDNVGNKGEETSTFKTPVFAVELTSPENDSTTGGDSPLVSGKSIPNAKITVSAGEQQCTTTTDSEGNWSCELTNLSEGPQKVTVVAELGSQKATDEHNITVPTTPLTISSPESNQVLTSPSLTASGTTDPNAKITASVGDKNCTTTADSAGNWSCEIDELPEGTQKLVVVSTLDDKNKTKELPINVPITPLIISAPQNNQTLTSPSLTANGTTTPNAKVTASVGEKSCTTTADSAGNWSCKIDDLPGGAQKLVVVSTLDDESKTKELDINVPVTPLIISSPKENELITTAPIVTIGGTTTPKAKVTVTTDKNESCSVIADDNGDWKCSLSVTTPEEEKTLTVTSQFGEEKQTANINVRFEQEATTKPDDGVTTVLKGSGSSSPLGLFIMSLGIFILRKIIRK